MVQLFREFNRTCLAGHRFVLQAITLTRTVLREFCGIEYLQRAGLLTVHFEQQRCTIRPIIAKPVLLRAGADKSLIPKD